MCGVAGIMTRGGRPVDPRMLERMGAALAHRGPDGRGMHVAGNVGLAHTRLAIIDLETGGQPLAAGNGDAATVLVANGEIYNNLELRAELAEVSFATRSDCEPPLALYDRLQLNFAEKLRGMYAVALHDPVRQSLVLARDPFGIKPLYLWETPQGLLFASETGALLAGGTGVPDLNESKVTEFLQLQFTTGDETLFDGIRRLMPGETVLVRDGRIIERRRLPALPRLTTRGRMTEAEALERLETVLVESVELHQRSDVPYGMFLSGGIDSSAILAMMARLNDRPVRAYTAHFPGTGVRDERVQAAAVARAVGADHVEVAYSAEDFWEDLPAVAAALDDPVADYAVMPTFKLAQAARADGFKVVLSGEGGDELFGGYGRYRTARRPWPFAKPLRRKGIFDGLGMLRGGEGWRDGVVAAEAELLTGGNLTRLQQAQAVDVADWLPNDLLIKLDRCLMAHGVEGRVPFLDPAVADLAFRLPDGLKIRGRTGKWLLRRWLLRELPDSRPMTPKRGFTVPVGEWIGARGREIGPLVAAQPGVARFCLPEAVGALFADPRGRAGKAAWTLLLFALWHQHWVLGNRTDNTIVESLSNP